jgi:hypothetical protein
MGHLIQLRAAVERATVAGKLVQAETGTGTVTTPQNKR